MRKISVETRRQCCKCEVACVAGHGGQRDPGHKLGLLQLGLITILGLTVLLRSLSTPLQLPLPGGGQQVQVLVKDRKADAPHLKLSVETFQGADLSESTLFELLTGFLNRNDGVSKVYNAVGVILELVQYKVKMNTIFLRSFSWHLWHVE